MEMTIGVKIRALRALTGLNQTEFAKLINSSRAIVGPIEAERMLPTDTFLRDAETALGISFSDPVIEQFVTLKPVLDGQAAKVLTGHEQPEPCAA